MEPHAWTLLHLVALYALVLVALGLLDAIWLGLLAKGLYKREMGTLMNESPRKGAAVLFYLLYPLAVLFFGLVPLGASVTGTGHFSDAFLRCAALGLTAYGTYNLTNLTIVRGFGSLLAVVDLAWGTFATGLCGAFASAVVAWWLSSH